MMYVKLHSSGERFHNRTVIAVCDEEILGKTFSEEEISIKVSEQFYKGDKKSFEEVVTILKEAPNCNLIGKEAVEAGIKAGIIDKTSVKSIGGVPHAQSISV